MTPSETRTLVRSSIVLLVASGIRAGIGLATTGDSDLPRHQDEVVEVAEATDSALAREERRTRPLEPGETLDLNTADSLELQRLPRVGPSMAKAIIEARGRSRGIRTWDELDAIPGIGPATLERLRPYVAPLAESPSQLPSPVRSEEPARGAATPAVWVNRATPLELRALPGIGPTLASRIADHRARHGPFQGIDDLLQVSGIGPATLRKLRPYLRLRP